MKLKPPLAVLLAMLACAAMTKAQNKDSASPTGPPRFLNMVHQELKPGDGGAYDTSEAALVTSYNRENIPAYWVGLESVTVLPKCSS